MEFWKGIYEKEEDPTQNDWTREILTNNEWIETGILITKEEIQRAIKRIPNWKAPGNDQIQGYWYKYLNNVIDCLKSIFRKWILNSENIPETVCKGITVLIYKGGDTNDPKNYRPITCLNLILKIFTSILKRRMEITLKRNDENKRISLNQLGCKQYSYASKEGLLQNSLLQAMLNE